MTTENAIIEDLGSLDLKTQQVRIAGELYELKELTGTQRDAYLSDNSARMTWKDGKPAGIKNFDGLQAALLSRSLYDPQGKLVPKQVLQKWPSSVVGRLFELSRQLSGLEEEEVQEEEAKNGSTNANDETGSD